MVITQSEISTKLACVENVPEEGIDAREAFFNKFAIDRSLMRF